MNNKFLVFIDRDWNSIIQLSCVNYHKDIIPPKNVAVRCGGGWWEINGDTLRLYSSSDDFGKYDQSYAQEAFDKKNVFYFEENIFEDSNITKLIME